MRNAGLASISSTFTPSPPHNGQSSAHTSVIQKILQPIQKNKRREIEDASSNDNRTKRARSTGPKENMSDNEVIIVDGPLERRPINLVPKHQEEQRTLYSPEDRLDPFETINCFRLNPKTLGYVSPCDLMNDSLTWYCRTAAGRGIKYYTSLSAILSPQQNSSRGRRFTVPRSVKPVVYHLGVILVIV